MDQEVVRRFEVRAAGSQSLNRVELALKTAKQQGRVQVLDLNPVERPPSLQVRLRGAVAAVARVMEDIGDKDVRIVRDFVDVPSDASPDRIFPDPWPLLRMSTAPRPKPDAKPNTQGAPVKQPPRQVKVAIVDSGIMFDHVDLKPHLQPAFPGGGEIPRARFIGDKVDNTVTDEDGHGTMLAGTLLATASFSRAIQIIPVKFFDAGTRPVAKNAVPAIEFALAEGADIILVSWELGSDSDDVRKAIRQACEAGKLVVFAAGNQGSDNDKLPAYPSRYARKWPGQTITVMATDQYDEKAWFSNYGAKFVDIAAPGVEILSTRPYLSKAAETPAGQALRYCRYHGTSAASAHVAGAAALLLSLDPSLSLEPRETAKRLKDRLMGSVAKLPGLKCASRGRLDLGKALAGATPRAPVRSGTP
jgi:hypothetical protein